MSNWEEKFIACSKGSSDTEKQRAENAEKMIPEDFSMTDNQAKAVEVYKTESVNIIFWTSFSFLPQKETKAPNG